MTAFSRFFSAMMISAACVDAGSPAGAEVFQEHCASCHGTDGKGRTPAGRKIGVKDLTESKIPEAEVIRQILDGTTDKKGKQRMPAFRDKLTAKEVADLASTILSLRRS